MNRRDFLKKLAGAAALGTIAPSVVEALAPAIRHYNPEDVKIVWGGIEVDPVSDMIAAIERIKADSSYREPSTMVIDERPWRMLVEALDEHHPELGNVARRL